MKASAVAALAVAAALAATGCGKKASSGGFSSLDEAPLEAPAAPLDPVEAEAWKQATDGTEEDLMRLANLVGCTTLRQRAEQRKVRLVAIRAMSECEDFSELPWLATLASAGPDAEADAALESIVHLAARPRRPVDPEDGRELAEGCRTLLDLARASNQPRARRVVAVRALRMLSERGCVKRSDIPADFDDKG